jgi:glutaredoxin
MSEIIAPVRKVLGLFLEAGFRAMAPGSAVRRGPEAQRRVDKECEHLALYHFEGCPFCIKVRAKIRRLGLEIELRDIRKNPDFEKELLAGGGEYQVPCLRIHQEDGSYRWMYESDDINVYLESRYG